MHGICVEIISHVLFKYHKVLLQGLGLNFNYLHGSSSHRPLWLLHSDFVGVPLPMSTWVKSPVCMPDPAM